MLFTKLSLVMAQGQKYRTPNENQTHNQSNFYYTTMHPLGFDYYRSP